MGQAGAGAPRCVLVGRAPLSRWVQDQRLVPRGSDSAVHPELMGHPQGDPGREEATLHPAGPGLQNDTQGEGSLKASRATKGQLNRLQNKEGHRPPKAQIAAVMGAAGGRWGPAQTQDSAPSTLLGLASRFESTHIRFPSAKLTVSLTHTQRDL